MKKRAFSIVALLMGLLFALTLGGCGEMESEDVIAPVYWGRTSGTLGSADAGNDNQDVDIGSNYIAYAGTGGNAITGLHTSGGDKRTAGVGYPGVSVGASRSWAYLYRGTEKIGIIYQYAAGVSVPGPADPSSKYTTYYLGKSRCDQLAVNQIRTVFGSACDTSDMTDTYHGVGAKGIASL